MSGSGRAGNGRGNNRKRLFRRHDENWQEGESSGRPSSSRNDSSQGGSAQGKKHSGRSSHQSSEPQGRGGRQQWQEENRRNMRADGTSPKSDGARSADSQASSVFGRRGSPRRGGENFKGERAPFFERPKWVPPKLNTDPLPVPDCPYCGKPIRDISSAISDRDSELPVHFDCVAAKIAGNERLERGDSIVYIGGGRFGVVNFGGSEGYSQRTGGQRTDGRASPDNLQKRGPGPLPATHNFRIKKIIEWEDKDKRAGWRSVICEHYSVT